MITTSDEYVIEDSDKVVFTALDILCVPTVLDEDDTVNVEVYVVTDTGLRRASILLSFTNSEIEAFTASGTTDRDKFYNQVEQAVKDYLDGLTGNDSATFTI